MDHIKIGVGFVNVSVCFPVLLFGKSAEFEGLNY